MAARKSVAKKSTPKKTTVVAKKGPPTPKSTKNMPPGLAAYWKKRGVSG
jgi:hypothetical protein